MCLDAFENARLAVAVPSDNSMGTFFPLGDSRTSGETCLADKIPYSGSSQLTAFTRYSTRAETMLLRLV